MDLTPATPQAQGTSTAHPTAAGTPNPRASQIPQAVRTPGLRLAGALRSHAARHLARAVATGTADAMVGAVLHLLHRLVS